MERRQANISFPEDLVERIVAKLPFPSILKAQFLSKSWQAKFEPISCLHDEEQKRKARAFHKIVAECTTHWETFLPVATTELDLIGYTPTSPDDVCEAEMDFTDYKQIPETGPENERRRRSLAFLPIPTGSKWQGAFLLRSMSYLPIIPAGSRWREAELVHTILYGTLDIDGYNPEVYVSTILSTRWKLLPRPPRVDDKWCSCYVHCLKLVRDTSESCCKVILFSEKEHSTHGDDHFCVKIYDSKIDDWSSKTFQLSEGLRMRPSTCAYHNGVLYMATPEKLPKLLAFNEQTWDLKTLSFSLQERREIHTAKLVVCNGSLALIAIENRFDNWIFAQGKFVRVLEADLGRLRFSEVVRCSTGLKVDMMNFGAFDVGDVIWDIRQVGQPMRAALHLRHGSTLGDLWTIFNFYIPGTVYRWSSFVRNGESTHYELGCRYGATVKH